VLTNKQKLAPSDDRHRHPDADQETNSDAMVASAFSRNLRP